MTHAQIDAILSILIFYGMIVLVIARMSVGA